MLELSWGKDGGGWWDLRVGGMTHASYKKLEGLWILLCSGSVDEHLDADAYTEEQVRERLKMRYLLLREN